MNTDKLTLPGLTAALSLATCLCLSNGVKAEAMSSHLHEALVDVCQAAKSNNTIDLYKTVRGFNLNTETVALKVVCNGESIQDFAASHGAYRTAQKLADSISDVSIQDLAQQKWAVNF
ncbi:DUF3718 domain-containing protein [Thalassotalea aquiviva]|uniref:DUF3718 domain-containing protein n=1 Tax=Thalassotalea aquiviva TaxID=3242415 RepID=UPI00352A24D7